MKKLVLFCLFSTLCFCAAFCQKQMMNYPFEFEKSFLQKSNYNAYFLNDNMGNFALILQDNKKADYVLVDKNFKVTAKIATPISATVFKDNDKDYIGGTASAGVYNFIYKQTDTHFFGKDKISYMMESVDFNAKTISQKNLFEIPKQEKLLSSFSDNGRYFSITADDKAGNLVIYTLAADGAVVQKTIPFTVPAGMAKGKSELSGYLADLQLVKSKEEPGLDQAVKDAKLYSYPNGLVFTINYKDNPTHIFTVNLNDFTYQENFIDHGTLIPADIKGKNNVSSFIKDGLLFELLLTKKSMVVAVYSLPTGQLLKSQEINEDTNEGIFAEGPVNNQRTGKNVTSKDVTDIKKLIRTFIYGTEGVTVGKNKEGQYIVTIGTWDLIAISHGSGPSYVGGFQPTGYVASNGMPMTTYNPSLYFKPGTTYITTSSRYYKTTYFKILLDPKTFAVTHGRVPRSVNDQIKDYLEDGVDTKAKATNQFAMGGNEYYGYYSKEDQRYIIEQIFIVR